MVHNDMFEWLKDKPYISVPQYQLERGVSYTEAKADIEELKRMYYIYEKPEGLYYKVNNRIFDRRELNFGECLKIAERLTEGEVFVLKYLIKSRMFEASALCEEKSCQSLVARDLIFNFCGAYFLSITTESAELIFDNTNPETDSAVIAYIAHPILVACIEKKKRPDELLQLPFIPIEGKIYISEGWDRYKSERIKPAELRISEEVKQQPISRLRFEIIESCISQFDFINKKQIEEEAQKNAIAIKSSPLCSPEFKKNASDAAREICEELTFGNLLEIKKIISGNSGCSIDDDDEEDEDDDD